MNGGDFPDEPTQHYSERTRETLGRSLYGPWRSAMDTEAVPLSFGRPYPAAFPEDDLIGAITDVFDEEAEDALQYGGGEYADLLADAVVDIVGNRGVECTPDEVVLTNGAKHALDIVCRTFLDPGDLIATESPTYMTGLRLFRDYGVDIEGYGMDADGLDVDALAADLETRAGNGDPIPTLVYTVPNFQNPTGKTLSRERRTRLLELAETYDFLILEDDPYGELRFDGEDPPLLKELDESGRVIHVNTFSKTVGPGLRTGWILADEPVAARLERMNPGGTNVFTQSLIARYWDADRYEENVAEVCEGYEKRRDAMLEALETHMPPGTDWNDPDGGYFVWIRFPEGVDAEAMVPDAADRGVTYLPGSVFHPGEGGRRNARLSFSHPSPERVEEGIARLAAAVREHRVSPAAD